MNVFLIFIVAGIAMIGYAVYGIFSASGSDRPTGPKRKLAEQDALLKEQKIERLEAQIMSLEDELGEAKANFEKARKDLGAAKNKETQLQEELARRQDWVAKSEEILQKAKQEKSDWENKFIAKEKELEAEFAKNVDLNRSQRELSDKLRILEKETKANLEQIEAQKHQIEGYIREIKKREDTVAEFKKKEQTSEWVPKTEFHKLNEEYTELEKELEAKEERLKNFAQQIVQLKNQLNNKPKQAGPAKGEDI